MKFLKNLFRKKQLPKYSVTAPPTGLDPFDVHGDGSVRPGDPMYDFLMRVMDGGEPVVGEYHTSLDKDGNIEIEIRVKD